MCVCACVWGCMCVVRVRARACLCVCSPPLSVTLCVCVCVVGACVRAGARVCVCVHDSRVVWCWWQSRRWSVHTAIREPAPSLAGQQLVDVLATSPDIRYSDWDKVSVPSSLFLSTFLPLSYHHHDHHHHHHHHHHQHQLVFVVAVVDIVLR